MSRAPFAALVVLSVAAGGCRGNAAKSPQAGGKLAGPLAAAFREDAIGDELKAVDLYTRALEDAATSPDDTESVTVTMAALDALAHGSVAAFADVASTSALADRVDPVRSRRMAVPSTSVSRRCSITQRARSRLTSSPPPASRSPSAQVTRRRPRPCVPAVVACERHS